MRPASMLSTAALLAMGVVASAAAQTADRYGYAPPEAQVPVHQAAPVAPSLRSTPAAPPLRMASVSAPPLRMLSWPGKAAPGATPPPMSAPAPVAVRAAPRPSRPAIRAAASPPPTWTPRTQWRPSRPAAPASFATAPAPPSGASAAAGVGPAPRPTFVAPPGLIARAPASPPVAVAASAPPQGVAAMGPPRNPWYQRWPDAAAAPDPTVGAGVGASLAPGTPASPPPVSALSGYAPPAAGAAPVRMALAASAPGGTAKYYSVHTAYGHAPDPAPIPPQFFGPTADLSTPETAEPARATLTANASAAKAAVNAARLQQGAVD